MRRNFVVSVAVGVAVAVVASVCVACSDGGSSTDGDAAVDTVRHDGGEGEAVVLDVGTELPLCGDGLCQLGENCLDCPADCVCQCGDGLCTHGEFCAVCPDDCDCETLAATPPMGWNSWNLFRCEIDEDLVKGIADAMVDSGMRDVGYRYVNLDDCWQADRGEDGVVIADAVRFPSGIGALADYVHSRGLKFGLYTCAGTHTCEVLPGSYGFEKQDADTYAEWGVDFVKVDWCFTEGMDPRTRYSAFREAIDQCGREILLSICNWGIDEPWVWGPHTGEMWRTSHDIFDHVIGMLANLFVVEDLAGFPAIGHWNDPDMLEVGNGGMSNSEYEAHFALWSVLASPLISGNDLRDMDEPTRKILLNDELIAVNQDPNGLQAVLLDEKEDIKVYARPLTLPGSRVLLFYNNHADEPRPGTYELSKLGLAPGPVAARDLVAREDLEDVKGIFSAVVPPFGAVAVKLDGREMTPPTGTSYLSELPWMYAANSMGPVERDTSVGGEVPGDGHALQVGGETFAHGLGVHAGSIILYHLGKRCNSFAATVGIDAGGEGGTVVFQVWADGELLLDSGTVNAGDDGMAVSVELTDKRELKLVVTPAGDTAKGDHADWADARITCD